MQMPTFEIPTIRQEWHLIQQNDYFFSIDLKNSYLNISTVNHHHFLHFVWQSKPYQWKVLPFRLAMAPRVSLLSLKPCCFCWCKGFFIITYLADILVFIHSKHSGKRAQSFLSSYWFFLEYLLMFPSLKLCLPLHFSFVGLFWIQWICPYLCPLKNSLKYGSGLFLCFTCILLQYVRLCPFLNQATFCANKHAQLCCLCRVTLSSMLQFLLANVLMIIDAMHSHWVFYF